jgi:hypothetical protein
MKTTNRMRVHVLLWLLALVLSMPLGGVVAHGQDYGDQGMFDQEELDQMLAPIALYPDELLVQVLMAATYPLEVVQANRWAQARPNLSGDQLALELEQQNWDPSVKSLVNFPSLLQMMNDRLEWTQRLGDAFLSQEDQVMDTVQALRQRAFTQGYLRTTNEERVIVDPQTRIITIEPAAPQIVYAPVYDPAIVFGSWWWPSHPPYRYYPRGQIIGGAFIRLGFFAVAWGYAWGDFDWHHRHVVVNTGRNANFNRRIDRSRYADRVTAGRGGQGTWKHDPDHRRGIAYRAPVVAQKFGRGPMPGVDARRDYRGFGRVATGRISTQPPGPLPQPRAQSRPTTAPAISKVKPQEQPIASLRQPRATTAPSVARVAPVKQPPVTITRATQGLQGPTVFGGQAPESQAREFSKRGRESLSSARTRAVAPIVSKPLSPDERPARKTGGEGAGPVVKSRGGNAEGARQGEDKPGAFHGGPTNR